eukprot:GHVO01000426.1.p1 GENE.GHVO01000426.1~~GHVO01000426.1.p1  ORF type:complete len:119 (-),score=8.48 GHVO01000426.1:69-425(-)
MNRLLGYRCPGQKIEWKTDSKVLISWATIRDEETRRPRVKHALELIAYYQIEVIHIPGDENPADYVSRYPHEDHPEQLPIQNFVKIPQNEGTPADDEATDTTTTRKIPTCLSPAPKEF